MQEPNGQSAAELELRSLYRLPRSIPQLDRLRGLAILLVLMNHTKKAAPQYFDGILRQGWIGVDLFFVLSGFLITGILWESRGEKGYFKRFYVRRILRIWPVYLIILFLVFAIVPLIRHLSGLSAGTLLGEPYGVWAYLLFIQNLLGPALYYSPLLSITWSLAIEEQFYLVWPAILRICRRLIILPILLAGLSAAPLIRLIARHHGVSDIVIYICPFTHYDGLLCGAFVAIWLRSATPKRMTLLLAGSALMIAGVSLFLSIQAFFTTNVPCFPLLYTAVAIFSTGLLLIALVSENTGKQLHRLFFMNGTLAFFGFISYGLYLYHFSIMHISLSYNLAARLDRWHHPSMTAGLMAAGGLGLSILVAWVSRVTLERAALSKKSLFV